MTIPSAMAVPPYKPGYRRFKWRDSGRNRPVWGDVWFPSNDVSKEIAISWGLGEGKIVRDATLASVGAPFPLVVMSPGASGSAPSYSWLAEYLARHGVIVLGVSHYGESWLYGAETVEPGAVMRLWVRPADCSFALTQLLTCDELRACVDPTRIGALGHSSGGATALALGGATLDYAALSEYCRSEDGESDRGCLYARTLDMPPEPMTSPGVYRDTRVTAIVALDPAAGPGHDAASLANVRMPVLIVGSEDNDFLPFTRHAGHYAALLPNAALVTLRNGEGHFVYLNSCTSDLSANGVPLCRDRQGVDREAVHADLAARILAFFLAVMWQ